MSWFGEEHQRFHRYWVKETNWKNKVKKIGVASQRKERKKASKQARSLHWKSIELLGRLRAQANKTAWTPFIVINKHEILRSVWSGLNEDRSLKAHGPWFKATVAYSMGYILWEISYLQLIIGAFFAEYLFILENEVWQIQIYFFRISIVEE